MFSITKKAMISHLECGSGSGRGRHTKKLSKKITVSTSRQKESHETARLSAYPVPAKAVEKELQA
jgi:hypothetical protein